jgi:hypothetical protein
LRDVSLSAPKLQDFPEERAAPRRRAAVSEPDPFHAPRKKRSTLARVFAPRRMGFLVLLGIGGLALVGVPMNALFFQDGRHPAPLFSVQAPAPEAENVAAAAPTPPTRPAQMQAARAEAEAVRPEAPARPAQRSAAKSEAAASKAEIMKTEAPAPAKADKKRDPISQLLGVGETAPTEAPDKNVLAAQRALQKLGYVVKPDGLLGGGTRQAIEKFERDNHLPPKGEVNARLMKLLTARAGVAAR